MSQHIFPAAAGGNALTATVGYDPQTADFFALTEDAAGEPRFSSKPARTWDDAAAQLLEREHVTVPQAIADAVQKDYADFRLGASDVGRRIFHYDATGVALKAETH